ncbi:hypothetical protein PoMZ_06123 [Pyricularia oryzae]|uniref:Uncharacterized protein n=1 Tax=Pyricularia oryzae TaxID=318829 RepID=A0A4P7NPW9_PYROR|nr:hypothetical protein PoMZ_06123 [Pyricularia oryzae]
MPKPFFKLAPKWGEQPRKTFPLPAKSDLRKITKNQFGQFGEIFIPFRCKNRTRGSVSFGNIDEFYLAYERAALRFDIPSLFCIFLVPGVASTNKGQKKQQFQPIGDFSPLQTTPIYPNLKKAVSTADLPMEPSKSGRFTVGYFPTDARNSINYNNSFLIRFAERSPISPLEPISEAQKEPNEQIFKKDRKSLKSRSNPRPAAAGKRLLGPFTINKSGRRLSGNLVGRSTAQIYAAQTIGAIFAPLPSVNTILRPVSSATTTKSPLFALPETFPTATNIVSPIFGNINPLPALRRAISDLIPQRPAYFYDPLFDNYAPKQPFHIQWRRGGVDGQQSPITTHMASPPIKFQKSLISTLPLSLDPNIITTPSGAFHPGRPFITESIARFGQQR